MKTFTAIILFVAVLMIAGCFSGGSGWRINADTNGTIVKAELGAPMVHQQEGGAIKIP